MKSKLTKVLASLLCAIMLFSVLPVNVLGAWGDSNVVFDGTSFGTNGYYNVISKKDYTLVPGAAVESEMVINNASGNRRQVMHIIEVDPSNPDVSILPGYYGIDKDLTDPKNHKAAGVTEVVKYYEEQLNYNVVGAMNTGLAYDCNAPYSWLVYNGKVLVDHKNGINDFHTGYCQTMLCVYKNDDGTCYCELRTASQGLRGDEWQAIGANFGMVVTDGKLVSQTEERTSDPAARSMVGVKEDGTLVLVMNDGRGANNSVGFCNYEEGEAMLALGCKWAFNCDGGGSSSFVTKRSGEDKAVMRSFPCDGAERATLNSVLIVSNADKTGELGSLEVESGYDYFVPNSTYTFGVDAIDTHGYAMDTPADVQWSLSDSTHGTIDADGTFKSNGTLGEVTVTCTSGGVVGQKTITVANPAVAKFAQDSTVLPYGKSFTLSMDVWYDEDGEFPMYYQASAFDWEFSDQDAGQLDMDTMTYQATSDESIASVTITAKYKAAAMADLVLTINFGKGSEVIFDFEDGDKGGFMGFEEAKQWSIDHGVDNTLDNAMDENEGPLAGQYSPYAHGSTSIVTAENGQVKNGNYALAWTLDNSDVNFNNWTYNVLFYVEDQIALRDVANGKNAVRLGMWLYIPEGATGLSFQSQLYTATGGCAQLDFTFTTVDGSVKNLNSCKEADIPESRWVYASVDLTGYNYLATADAMNPGSSTRNPSIIRTYIKPAEPFIHTFYIDDITLDYSDAVDDREAPAIGDIQYAADGEGSADGATIGANSASFTASVSDKGGLDETSAQIYIDGNEVETKVAGGYMTTNGNLTLTNGFHVVTFEVADMLGNKSQRSASITVKYSDEAPLISVDGHNDSGDMPLADSVYYVDLKTSNAADVQVVKFKIKLNSANHWELDRMIAAAGFKAEYQILSGDAAYATVALFPEIHSTDNVAVITLTRETDCALEGEQTLLSIPVRVWSWGGYSGVTGQSVPAPEVHPLVTVDYKVLYGYVERTSGAHETFNGRASVATELNGIDNTWHTHTAAPIYDKQPTCTEDGYTGRTYCDVCKSVVDWGTKLPATGHNYALNGNKFVCTNDDCGHVYPSGTGVFRMNGKLYYSINGGLVTGWQDTDNGGHCFAYSDYHLAVGEAIINNITYIFDENGSTMGAWFSDEHGFKYSYGPDYYRCTAANHHANAVWATIGGEKYAFDKNGYRHENISILVESNDPGKVYEFTSEGVLIGEYVSDNTGILVCNNATTYLKNGVPVQAGLVYEDGYYYYINSGYVAVTGTYNVTRTNGLLPVGTYNFDSDGKMIDPPSVKNGPQEDGTFYLNDVQLLSRQLIEYQYAYYFLDYYDGDYRVVKSAKLYLDEDILKNTEFKAGYYNFDQDGKLLILNGPQEDGTFYLNGAQQLSYQLVEYNGDYYFIDHYDGDHRIVKNKKLYLGQEFLEGTRFVNGVFEFGPDGRMVILDGIQPDGTFYIDGVKQLAYQLIECKGDYYFIDHYDGDHRIVKNKKLYLGQEFLEGTRFVNGVFEFGPDGRMVILDGIQPDGTFYIDGVKQLAYQLIEYKGDYYFIDYYNGDHRIVKNKKLYLGKEFLDGTRFVNGVFEFGPDGRMVILDGIQPDGTFYIDGVKQLAYQLIEYKGDYYFIDYYNGDHRIVKNKKLYLGQEFLKDTQFVSGVFEFGAEGKMVILDGIQEDGTFYLDGVKQLSYQLIEYNGDYYFIDYYNGDHRIVKNKKLYLGQEFLDGTRFVNGVFEFGEDGKMLILNGPQSDGTFYIDGVKQLAYQMVKYEGAYYFVSDYHKIAKNKTLYIRQEFLTGTELKAGYYTFDQDGKMLILNGPQPDGTFYIDGVKQLSYQLVEYKGDYYFIDHYDGDHRIVKNKQVYLKQSLLEGTPFKEWYYTFDAEGRMVGYIEGLVPNGRDIGARDYLTTTDGKDIKAGLLIRGPQLDGWEAEPLTEEQRQVAIDVLKNTYKVKFDMDLRPTPLSDVEVPDALGENVKHTYYGMAFYDDVFTDSGKAAIKNIFTDLSNPANYPIYVHCTRGVDRTGIVCYILEAVLGVPEGRLNNEYMLSVGAYGRSILKIRDGLKSGYEGNTIKECAEAFLLDCGITNEQIQSLRDIYIGE